MTQIVTGDDTWEDMDILDVGKVGKVVNVGKVGSTISGGVNFIPTNNYNSNFQKNLTNEINKIQEVDIDYLNMEF